MRDETDTRPERGPEPGFALRRIDGPSQMALPAQPGVGLLVQIAGRGRFECPEAGPIGLGARDALVHDAARPARLAMAEPGARAVEALFHPDYLREVARVELGAMSAAPHAGTSRVLGDPALASLAASMLELGRGDAATLSATARALAARLLGRHILALATAAPTRACAGCWRTSSATSTASSGSRSWPRSRASACSTSRACSRAGWACRPRRTCAPAAWRAPSG